MGGVPTLPRRSFRSRAGSFTPAAMAPPARAAVKSAVRGVGITIIDDGAEGRQNRIRVCHIKHDPPRRQPLHLRAAERYCGPCAPRFEHTLCDPRYATQLTTRYAVLQSP